MQLLSHLTEAVPGIYAIPQVYFPTQIGSPCGLCMLHNPVTGALKVFTVLQRNASVDT